MPILYNKKEKSFKLRAKNTDYMFKVVDDGLSCTCLLR